MNRVLKDFESKCSLGGDLHLQRISNCFHFITKFSFQMEWWLFKVLLELVYYLIAYILPTLDYAIPSLKVYPCFDSFKIMEFQNLKN